MSTFKILFNLTSVSIFCISILVSIYMNINDEFGGRIHIKLAKAAIFSFCLSIIIRTFCMFSSLGLSNYNIYINVLLNELTFFFFAQASYLSFNYINITFSTAHSKRFQLISSIPLALVFIVCIISFIRHSFYDNITDAIFNRGAEYTFNIIINYIYMFSALFITIKSVLTTSFHINRIESIKISAYILIIMIGVGIHTAYPYTSILDIAITLPLFLMFIRFQESRIFNDSLTNLNNRKRSVEYISELIPTTDINNAFYLFIVDMNDFKNINDNFGHNEGDRALIVAATALKQVANKVKGFTARIGGDEFIIVVEKNRIQNPENMMQMLRNTLDALNSSENLKLPLSFSIGYAICDSYNKSTKLLLAEADRMLYLDKQNYHRMQSAYELTDSNQ